MPPAPKQWALFSFIEDYQGATPWGRVLDAGTGVRSLRWLSGLASDSLTAVTGDPKMERQVERQVVDWRRPGDRLLVGNWADPAFLAGERFDTVLADFLLGAIEGFAPYFQGQLFARLRPLTAGRLYFTGVEPYVVRRPATSAGALVWEIGRYRDSCLSLLGKQPYREYPLFWVLAQLRRAGFNPAAARKFPAGYTAQFVTAQIDLARPGLERMADRALGQALIAHGEALKARALAHIESHGALSHGFSYAVAAEPV